MIKQYLCAVFIVQVTDEVARSLVGGDDASDIKFYNLSDIDFSQISFETTRDLLLRLKADTEKHA